MLVSIVLGDSRIDALIPPAGDNDIVRVRGYLPDFYLGQRYSGGRRNRQDSFRVHQAVRAAFRGAVRRLAWQVAPYSIDGFAPNIGPHHHAGPPAVGSVIDGMVWIIGEIAQIRDVPAQHPVLRRFAQQRQTEHLKELGKNRQNLKTHHPHLYSESLSTT